MSTLRNTGDGEAAEVVPPVRDKTELSPEDAESILNELASTYLNDRGIVGSLGAVHHSFERLGEIPISDSQLPNLEAKYRALVEQLPAVVFMAYLDRGIGEAYVSPQIEATLGFSQAEWLEDPVLWYRQVHPDDKERWSLEASEMFLSGKPLRSAYRVVARNGNVIWFHCEAKMIRHPDGRPWFIHGVAFDITDLKRTEEELGDERNVVSAILDTVGVLVIVLDREGRIVRLNRACEEMTGRSMEQARGQRIWDLFAAANEKEQFESVFRQVCEKQSPDRV
jgi:PAS domain S-box-containing protein